jgi:outer membrane protein assembly factor BamB
MASRKALALATAGSVVALATGLLGCESLRASALPEAPLWLHHPGSALSVSLRRPLTAESRQAGEQYEHGRPAIDAVHRRVFVGSSDNGLYALRAEDAATIWRFETLGPVQCEPLYDPTEDVVYFGSNDSALYKVRAVDGKLLWRFATGAEVSRQPVLYDGVLYFTNANEVAAAPAAGVRDDDRFACRRGDRARHGVHGVLGRCGAGVRSQERIGAVAAYRPRGRGGAKRGRRGAALP